MDYHPVEILEQEVIVQAFVKGLAGIKCPDGYFICLPVGAIDFSQLHVSVPGQAACSQNQVPYPHIVHEIEFARVSHLAFDVDRGPAFESPFIVYNYCISRSERKVFVLVIIKKEISRIEGYDPRRHFRRLEPFNDSVFKTGVRKYVIGIRKKVRQHHPRFYLVLTGARHVALQKNRVYLLCGH